MALAIIDDFRKGFVNGSAVEKRTALSFNSLFLASFQELLGLFMLVIGVLFRLCRGFGVWISLEVSRMEWRPMRNFSDLSIAHNQ